MYSFSSDDKILSFHYKDGSITKEQYQDAKNEVDSFAQKILDQPSVSDQNYSDFRNLVSTVQSKLIWYFPITYLIKFSFDKNV